MTNSEIKIKKWEEIKDSVLSAIPEEYKVETKGLKNDSEYFHVIVKLDENLIAEGQCDVRDDADIYGWTIDIEQIISPFKHNISIRVRVDDLEHLERVLNNWEHYKGKIFEYVDICKKINENIRMLEEIKTTIEGNLLHETFREEDRKKCFEKLFDVKEYIENNRVLEGQIKI